MQYQVPQFIEVEDKIIGGVLTLRQFLIIAAAGGLSFLFYFIFGSLAWFILTFFVGAIAVGVAFIKIQGRSVPTMVKAALAYYWSPRFYLWKSQEEATAQTFLETKVTAQDVAAEKEFVFHKKAPAEVLTFPHAAHLEKIIERPIEKSAEEPAEKSMHPLQSQTYAKDVTEKHIAVPPESAESDFSREPTPEPEKISPIDLGLLAKKKKEREMLHSPRSLEGVEHQNRTEVAEAYVKEMPLVIREKLAISRKVQDLLQKITTSKNSIPKRERRIFGVEKNPREHYELLRKATGEMEAARRVDYSDLHHK